MEEFEGGGEVFSNQSLTGQSGGVVGGAAFANRADPQDAPVDLEALSGPRRHR